MPLGFTNYSSFDHAERAILVGVELRNVHGVTTEDSLAELGALTESAGAEVAGQVQQRLKAIDPRTFIGKGKAVEVRELAGRGDDAAGAGPPQPAPASASAAASTAGTATARILLIGRTTYSSLAGKAGRARQNDGGVMMDSARS